jgi:Spy/CpxP family protein refolding chaperone
MLHNMILIWHGPCFLHEQKREITFKENITMKNLTMTLVAVLVATALSTYAFAYGPGWGRGHGGADSYGPDTSFLSQLNLTPEQTAKINALREANLRDTKPLRDKMYSKRGDLRLLWLQTNPDQNKVASVQKEIRALRDQMQDKITASRLEVLKVLTPEQQEKVKSFRGRGFGPGMGGGPGMKGGPGMGGGSGMGMRGNW